MTDNVIIIPTRLEAKRLPNKPLKKINNKEMILHVYEAAKKANVGEVIVASPNKEIYDLISSNNGICVKTEDTHNTGTDRIFEVFDKVLKKEPQTIINLQGDMPNIEPQAISDLINSVSLGHLLLLIEASKLGACKRVGELPGVARSATTGSEQLSFNLNEFRSH